MAEGHEKAWSGLIRVLATLDSKKSPKKLVFSKIRKFGFKRLPNKHGSATVYKNEKWDVVLKHAGVRIGPKPACAVPTKRFNGFSIQPCVSILTSAQFKVYMALERVLDCDTDFGDDDHKDNLGIYNSQLVAIDW